MVKATMPSILNVDSNIFMIFMRLYGTVEEVMIVYLSYIKNMAALMSISPSPLEKNSSRIWILCQNSLTRELKIGFVGLVI